jgi:hypothetical protein
MTRLSCKFLAALFLLNGLFSLKFGIHAVEWGSWLDLSPDAVLLLWGMLFWARRKTRFRGRVVALLAAGLTALIIFRAADMLVFASLSRRLNLALDSRLLPDFVFLFWHTRPAGAVLGAAAGFAAAAAALTGLLWRALKTVHAAAAQTGGPRVLAIGAALLMACALAAGTIDDRLPVPVGASVLERLSEEIGFMVDLAGERRRHHAAIEETKARAQRMPSDLGRLNGASVFLFVVESYGRTAFSDPRHAAVVLPAVQAAEGELRSAGFHMHSGFVSSPTFGGGSWLAHATLASGLSVENQIRHDMLLGSDLVPLAEYFNRAGYRSVQAMPGTLWAWPAGAYYRFQETYGAADFDYQGPAFGWATMPDQYVLAWLARRELQTASRPLFLECIMVSSHAAWDVQAPYLADWSRIGDGAIYHRLAPVVFSVGWRSLYRASQAYSTAIVYDLTVLTAFLRQFLTAGELVIIVGDHQPSGELTGAAQPWSVPVHVISRNKAAVDRVAATGWTDGLAPDLQQPESGMEALFWQVLEGLSRG